MEFVSGETAIKYTQNQDRKISQIVKLLGSSKEKIMESFEHTIKDADSSKKKLKQLIKRVSEPIAKNAILQAKNLGKVKLYSTIDEDMDEEFHIAVGEQTIKMDPSMIYCALILKNDGIRIVAFAGPEAVKTKKAGDLVRDISKILGGSGGGNESFGQGGGKNVSKLKDALIAAEQSILEK